MAIHQPLRVTFSLFLLFSCGGILYVSISSMHVHHSIHMSQSLAAGHEHKKTAIEDGHKLKPVSNGTLLSSVTVNQDVTSLAKPQDSIDSAHAVTKLSSTQEEKSNFNQDNTQVGWQSPGAVVSLSFYDQMQSSLRRLVSLLCWAGQVNLMVVEPFVTGTKLTGPVHPDLSRNVRFQNLFDVGMWNRNCATHSFSQLISWEQFIKNASRNVVLVEILYSPKNMDVPTARVKRSECGFGSLVKFWKDWLAPHHFKIHAKVCVNFRERNLLTLEEFNSMVFPTRNSSLDRNVSVIVNTWKGVAGGTSTLISIKDSKCAGNLNEYVNSMLTPSSHLLAQVDSYIEDYLSSDLSYTAVMIRWERLLLGNRDLQFSKCVDLIKRHMTSFRKNEQTRKFFMTFDIGRYGTQARSMRKYSHVLTQKSEELLAFANGQAVSYSEYEDRFTNVTGTSSSAYISIVQKVIATKAKCLLLVGGGTYQLNAAYMWRKHHPRQSCIKSMKFCK